MKKVKIKTWEQILSECTDSIIEEDEIPVDDNVFTDLMEEGLPRGRVIEIDYDGTWVDPKGKRYTITPGMIAEDEPPIQLKRIRID